MVYELLQWAIRVLKCLSTVNAFSVLNVKEKPTESWYNNITHGLFLLFKTKEQRSLIQFSVSWENHEERVRIKFKQCGYISV